MRQAEAARRIAVSVSTISRYESGHIALTDIATLQRICRTMNIPPRLLGLSDTLSTGKVAETGVDGQAVRDMQRRHILRGLAASAAALPALRVSAVPLLSQLDVAVFSPHTGGQPLALPQLTRTLAQVRAHFAGCRFQQLAACLPELITLAKASRDAAGHDARGPFDAALADVYVLGNELAIKLHENGAAWVMADRALAAARASGDPRVLARAQWRAAISLRRSKRPDPATAVVTRAAQDLRQATGLATGEDAGWYARMLCCAAYTEALAERADNAYTLLGHARDAVSEFPHSRFGFDDVDGYGISVARAVGDFGRAAQFAAQVHVGRFDTVERRARFHEDLAITRWGQGRPDQTFQALQAAEAIAPQEVRFRPWAHRLTANLLSCRRGTPGLDGLRGFAARIGVAACG